MSRQIQLRRGSATEHENFTGAEGEVTVDTTNHTLRVHDGVTPGGTMLARADTLSALKSDSFKTPDFANVQRATNGQVCLAEQNYLAICSKGAGEEAVLKIANNAAMTNSIIVAEIFITTPGQIYYTISAIIPKGCYYVSQNFDKILLMKI